MDSLTQPITENPGSLTPIGLNETSERVRRILDAAASGDLQSADSLLGDDSFWAKHEAYLAQHDAMQAEQARAERQRKRDRRWAAIPAEYREEYDPAKSHLDVKIYRYVKAWQPDNGRGIGLMGRSGLGKTRLLVRRLNQLECSWLYIPSSQLADAISDMYDQNWATANRAEAVYDEAEAVKVLMIDDIGMERVTDRVGEQLVKLVEGRVHRHRPILWTSNLGPDQLEARFGHRGQGFIRRLLEFSYTPS